MSVRHVWSQGFGDYNNGGSSTMFETGEGRSGKRSPLEPQDLGISPQQNLQQRVEVSKSSIFSEHLPEGTVEFGDTWLSFKQRERLFNKENGDSVTGSLWKAAVIPYTIDCSLTNLKDAVSAIKGAIKVWEEKTCLKFTKRTVEKEYVRFYRDTRCWVYDGLPMKTYSTVSVGYGCEKTNILTHLIGHVIGLYHHHNRMDRDNYIEVQHHNLRQGMKDPFSKVVKRFPHQVVQRYDYNSIMHFPLTAFSKSQSSQTLTSKASTRSIPSPYTVVSDNDRLQVEAMYSCTSVRRQRENIAEKAHRTAKSYSWIQPRSNDEYEMFSAVQKSVGEAGCVDWSNQDDCRGWKIAGFCETQEAVKQYCKKTCGTADVCKARGEECVGEDKHARCNSFLRFCNNANYKNWMKEYCCNACRRAASTKKSTCRDQPGDFCITNIKYCINSKNFRETYCCKTCQERNICRTNPKVCGIGGRCKNIGSFKYTCECPRGSVAIDGGKRCQADRCGGCDANSGTCVNIGGDTFRCKCREGFVLQNDGKTCKDLDECLTNVNRCGMGRCTNTDGSYTCHCNSGAVPVNSGKYCVEKTECTIKPPSQISPLNPIHPTAIGSGRLCGYTKERAAGGCDDRGLEPTGLCTRALGLSRASSRHRLPNSAFTASRGHLVLKDSNGKRWEASAWNARLYQEDSYATGEIGGWCAPTAEGNMRNLHYLTVDLGSKKRVAYIATQGRDKYFERVSQFKIEYSDTGNTNDFCPYLENGKEKIFEGNCDHVTPVLNQFHEPLIARYIRYIPWKFNYPCVRMELYGCDEEELQPDP